MISQSPYSEKIIKDYSPYDKNKTIQLINDAQKSFIKWINKRLARVDRLL